LCLSVVQLLGSPKVRQVLMIREDGDQVLGAEQVVPPCLQGTDDAKEFTIVDFVIPLCCAKGLRDVPTWMPVSVDVPLSQDGSSGKLRGIQFDYKWFHRVWHQEDRGFAELGFQRFKGMLALSCPFEQLVFPCEFIQGSGQFCKVADEPSVEVSES